MCRYIHVLSVTLKFHIQSWFNEYLYFTKGSTRTSFLWGGISTKCIVVQCRCLNAEFVMPTFSAVRSTYNVNTNFRDLNIFRKSGVKWPTCLYFQGLNEIFRGKNIEINRNNVWKIWHSRNVHLQKRSSFSIFLRKKHLSRFRLRSLPNNSSARSRWVCVTEGDDSNWHRRKLGHKRTFKKCGADPRNDNIP